MARPLTLADLPEDLARFAEAQLATGRFSSIEDVLRACMEALARKQRNDAKHAAINAALDEGERSGDFEGNPFDSVRRERGLPPGPR